MKDKLLILMKNEGLKPGQFAEKVGVNPAGISHILAGRNKPGFDLLQKILRTFPEVNPDWLLLDSEEVYRKDNTSDSAPQFAAASVETRAEILPEEQASEDAKIGVQNSAASSASSNQISVEKNPPVLPQQPTPSNPAKQVDRIVVLYTDGTCESYTPGK